MTSALPSGGTAAAEPAGWADLLLIPLTSPYARRHMIAGEWGEAPRAPYDVLRTRAGQALSDGGWTRLGVTQTRHHEAGPATALNLALAEARRPERRVALVDLDLGDRGVLRLLGQQLVERPGQPLTEGRLRLTANLALLAFHAPPGTETETIAGPDFRARLERALDRLNPDLVVLNVPPMLEGDAGIAAIEHCQTVLLVVDGTADTPALLRESEALIAPRRPLLGLFHHAAEG